MTKARSWWSGLLCSSCSKRVIVSQDNGFFRAVLDARGRNVVKAEAVCGACRKPELRKTAGRGTSAAETLARRESYGE
jgi:hypothetical protein